MNQRCHLAHCTCPGSETSAFIFPNTNKGRRVKPFKLAGHRAQLVSHINDTLFLVLLKAESRSDLTVTSAQN